MSADNAEDVVMVELLLTLSLLLIRLPALIGPGTSGLALLPAALLLGGGQLLLPRPRRLSASRGLAFLYVALLILIVVAYYRGGQDGEIYSARQAGEEIISLLLLGSFVFNAVLAEPDPEARRRRVLAVCFAPLAYVAANELLYFGGVRAPINSAGIENPGPAQLLSLLGLSGHRIFFPFGEGLNGFGEMAGIAFITSVIALRRMEGRLRLVGAVGIVASLYGLFAADARGPLLFALAVSLALLAVPRVLRSGATGLPLIIPFGPSIIVFALGLFAGTSVSSTFSRGNFDFTSATGRTDVWNAVLDFLGRFDFHQLVGWGFGGQLSSGVSYTYAYVVQSNAHPEFATAHNFILQSILDVGYLGTAMLLLVFVLALRNAGQQLRRAFDPGFAAVLGILVFLLLAGTLESTPGAATPAALGTFLLVTACACSRQPLGAVQPARAPAQPVFKHRAPSTRRAPNPSA
jgi:hypothetical protein